MLKFKSTILRGAAEERKELYISIIEKFFHEIYVGRDEFIRLLNKLPYRDAGRYIYSIMQYQHYESLINPSDSVIRPALLTFLVSSIEKQKNSYLKCFFLRLNTTDKLYLVNNFEFLTGRGKSRGFKKAFYGLLDESIYGDGYGVKYEHIDPKLTKLDEYVVKVVGAIFEMRNDFTHENKSVSPTAFMDDEYNTVVTVFASYDKRPREVNGQRRRNKKGRKREQLFATEILFEEYRKIIKRGCIESIKVNGK